MRVIYMQAVIPKIQFFINAILSGGQVGAVSMSSNYVIKGVLKNIDGPLETIIEYGPGNGIMTKALLKLLSPQGKLIVIESNPKFVKILQKIKDSRIHIIEGKIQDVITSEKMCYIKEAGLVVSSIPFSFLKTVEREQVIEKTYALLASRGSCVIFHQYSTLVKKPLEKYFNTVSVSFEPRNIFPCFIFFAKKS